MPNDLRRASPRRFSLRLVADASGHERGASPDTNEHECGLLRIPSHSRLERFVNIRVRRRPDSCPTMRRRPKGSARVPRLAGRSPKSERGARDEYRRKTIRRIVGFRGRASALVTENGEAALKREALAKRECTEEREAFEGKIRRSRTRRARKRLRGAPFVLSLLHSRLRLKSWRITSSLTSVLR